MRLFRRHCGHTRNSETVNGVRASSCQLSKSKGKGADRKRRFLSKLPCHESLGKTHRAMLPFPFQRGRKEFQVPKLASSTEAPVSEREASLLTALLPLLLGNPGPRETLLPAENSAPYLLVRSRRSLPGSHTSASLSSQQPWLSLLRKRTRSSSSFSLRSNIGPRWTGGQEMSSPIGIATG